MDGGEEPAFSVLLGNFLGQRSPANILVPAAQGHSSGRGRRKRGAGKGVLTARNWALGEGHSRGFPSSRVLGRGRAAAASRAQRPSRPLPPPGEAPAHGRPAPRPYRRGGRLGEPGSWTLPRPTARLPARRESPGAAGADVAKSRGGCARNMEGSPAPALARVATDLRRLLHPVYLLPPPLPGRRPVLTSKPT